MAKGITDATTKPARKFPNSNTNTKITISPPSIKFFSTVPMARFTNAERSIYGSITTPSGNDFVFQPCVFLHFQLLEMNFRPLTSW